MKENNNACKVHEKVSENNGQNKYEHEKEVDEIEEYCEGTIGVCVNDKLRVVCTNSNFQEIIHEDVVRIVLVKKLSKQLWKRK